MSYTKEEIEALRERIINNAMKLKGVPFCHRGATRFGTDCLGLGWQAFVRAGINHIPKTDGRTYEPNWYWFTTEQRFLNELLKYFNYTDNPMPADICTFKCFDKVKITHTAIYLGGENQSFIHAKSGKKVEIDHLTDVKWKRRFHRFMILKEFDI